MELILEEFDWKVQMIFKSYLNLLSLGKLGFQQSYCYFCIIFVYSWVSGQSFRENQKKVFFFLSRYSFVFKYIVWLVDSGWIEIFICFFRQVFFRIQVQRKEQEFAGVELGFVGRSLSFFVLDQNFGNYFSMVWCIFFSFGLEVFSRFWYIANFVNLGNFESCIEFIFFLLFISF